MNDDRSPFGRTGVLDITLGALVALSLAELVIHFHTAAVVLSFRSASRFIVLAGMILFAVLFWFERRELIARLCSLSSPQPPLPLVAALHLGVIAALAIALSFAAPETMGWFFGANAMFWAIELIAMVVLRAYDRGRFTFLTGYASMCCALFVILTTWNSISPWSETPRVVACFLFPLFVVLGQMVVRPRAIVRADATPAPTD